MPSWINQRGARLEVQNVFEDHVYLATRSAGHSSLFRVLVKVVSSSTIVLDRVYLQVPNVIFLEHKLSIVAELRELVAYDRRKNKPCTKFTPF